MLAYGDLDENALPAVTVQFTDELINANKSFDLLHLPNRAHGFFRTDRYYTRRMWNYFVTRLLGAKPPENYDLSPTTARQLQLTVRRQSDIPATRRRLHPCEQRL